MIWLAESEQKKIWDDVKPMFLEPAVTPAMMPEHAPQTSPNHGGPYRLSLSIWNEKHISLEDFAFSHKRLKDISVI